MTANKGRRCSVRVTNPDALTAIEADGIQDALEPLIEAGSILNKSGAMGYLLSLQKQGRIEQLGELEALQLAINFCRQANGGAGISAVPAAPEQAAPAPAHTSPDPEATPEPEKTAPAPVKTKFGTGISSGNLKN